MFCRATTSPPRSFCVQHVCVLTKLSCRAITKASRQAEPAELTAKTFGAQDAGSEKLSLWVADPTASRGLVHRHVVLIQQNARQVRAVRRSGLPFWGGEGGGAAEAALEFRSCAWFYDLLGR